MKILGSKKIRTFVYCTIFFIAACLVFAINYVENNYVRLLLFGIALVMFIALGVIYYHFNKGNTHQQSKKQCKKNIIGYCIIDLLLLSANFYLVSREDIFIDRITFAVVFGVLCLGAVLWVIGIKKYISMPYAQDKIEGEDEQSIKVRKLAEFMDNREIKSIMDYLLISMLIFSSLLGLILSHLN